MSIIIPVKNGVPLLGAQLEALTAQTIADRPEVVIADNGSRDGTADLVREWSSRLDVRVVDAADRPGQAHARNIAVQAAEGALLLFCDADDLVAPAWAAAAAEALSRFDVVGGRMRVEVLNNPATIASRTIYGEDGLPGGAWPWVLGANFATHRRVFEALGGFDERFVGSGEDVDFAWRAQAAGYTVGFAPDAIVDYRYRRGLRNLYRQYRVREPNEALLRELWPDRSVPVDSLSRQSAWLLTRLPFIALGPARRGIWVRNMARCSAAWDRVLRR